MLNTVLGLYVVHQYGPYLDSFYPELRDCLLVFALKWFTSLGFAFILIVLISMGSAFTADAEEIKASVIGMAFPLYFFCVVLQQIYATGYGIWFFVTLANVDGIE